MRERELCDASNAVLESRGMSWNEPGTGFERLIFAMSVKVVRLGRLSWNFGPSVRPQTASVWANWVLGY